MIHILVVGDDQDLNQVICRHLDDASYEASGCLSAAAAYNQLYAGHFDLIIPDIIMKYIVGIELAEHIRSQPLKEFIGIGWETALRTDGKEDEFAVI